MKIVIELNIRQRLGDLSASVNLQVSSISDIKPLQLLPLRCSISDYLYKVFCTWSTFIAYNNSVVEHQNRLRHWCSKVIGVLSSYNKHNRHK